MANLDLARQVRDRCRLTGQFVLRSGRVADEYFDKYQFEADPVLLDALAAEMAALVPNDVEVLAGGHLRDLGAAVDHVLCVIDRQEGGAEALASNGIRLSALLTREDLEHVQAS